MALDRKDNIAGGPISDTPALNVTLIVLDGFDEWSVGRFARAERVAIRHGAFVGAVAESFAESEGLLLGLEHFGFGEVEHIVGIEIFLEAVDVIINKEVDGERVGNHIYFDGLFHKILKYRLFLQSYEKSAT